MKYILCSNSQKYLTMECLLSYCGATTISIYSHPHRSMGQPGFSLSRLVLASLANLKLSSWFVSHVSHHLWVSKIPRTCSFSNNSRSTNGQRSIPKAYFKPLLISGPLMSISQRKSHGQAQCLRAGKCILLRVGEEWSEYFLNILNISEQ